MNEGLSEHYQQKLDDAKTESWLIALGIAMAGLLLFCLVQAALHDPKARLMVGLIAGTAATICTLRFAVLAVMKYRLKIKIAKRAMTE